MYMDDSAMSIYRELFRLIVDICTVVLSQESLIGLGVSLCVLLH